MALANKFGITDPAELARAEERISKKKAAYFQGKFSFYPCVVS